NCLIIMSATMKKKSFDTGIKLQVTRDSDKVNLQFVGKGLSEKELRSINEQLELIVGKDHHAVNIIHTGEALIISFQVLNN
ncbi:MAG: hypothetical protein R3321_04200, partial [Nitrososphaeraceae archaeon]|nr:hypothetical protein [Nitrososphaeraceae archaeon]